MIIPVPRNVSLQRVHPKPLCIFLIRTMGIQWVDTDPSVPTDPLNPLQTDFGS